MFTATANRDTAVAPEMAPQHDVGHALIDHLADLVTEDPGTEGGDAAHDAPVGTPELEAHAQHDDGVARVEGKQDEVHRELC